MNTARSATVPRSPVAHVQAVLHPQQQFGMANVVPIPLLVMMRNGSNGRRASSSSIVSSVMPELYHCSYFPASGSSTHDLPIGPFPSVNFKSCPFASAARAFGAVATAIDNC